MTHSSFAEPCVPHSSSDDATAHLTPAELEAALRAADPAVLLILPRILRRVIKHDCKLAGFGLRVPHHKSYVVGRQAVLEIVETAELGLAYETPLPDRVILLPWPSAKLTDWPAAAALAYYWRLLFHARVHAAMEERIASGALSTLAIRGRIQELGTTRFDEIRSVLGQEGFLLPPRNDESVYVEFAAVYLELRYFAGDLLPYYFPGLQDLAAVDALLRRDVDDAGLFRATRPAGAVAATLPVPSPEADRESTNGDNAILVEAATEIVTDLDPSEAEYQRLMHKVQRPAARGNVVRAAISRARAARRRRRSGWRGFDRPSRWTSIVWSGGSRLRWSRRGRVASLATASLGPGGPDNPRDLDARGPPALRSAKGVRGPRAGSLCDRSGGMAIVVGAPADQAATAQPARRADAEAPPQRVAAARRGAALGPKGDGNWVGSLKRRAEGRGAAAAAVTAEDYRRLGRGGAHRAESAGAGGAKETRRGAARQGRTIAAS